MVPPGGVNLVEPVLDHDRLPGGLRHLELEELLLGQIAPPVQDVERGLLEERPERGVDHDWDGAKEDGLPVSVAINAHAFRYIQKASHYYHLPGRASAILDP